MAFFAERRGLLYFQVRTNTGDALFRTNGTVEGTTHLGMAQRFTTDESSNWPAPPSPVRARGQYLFTGNDGTTGQELWHLPLNTVFCPPPAIIEATRAAGAVATYAGVQLDEDVKPGTRVRYSPPEGTLLPMGVTQVFAEVEEAGLPPPACTFLITVEDTTAPTLQCPADIETQVAEGGMSLPYTFAATATDAAGNEGACTFKVKVTELESGCGCGATQGSGGWVWLAGLGWWLWRRLPEPKGPGNTSRG
ncbi:hypothetical protein JYJ95_33850 [Corallococcus exiguus]|uniref:hypothetical protein n=1 Tax=Corallococcus exiguus TaxID=83462 RepID=UPI001A8E5B6E|nr:hypothetical protein [Corallococcus exiguus]MBN8471518.1 hypothetical protein [Corallococcus exiguus]